MDAVKKRYAAITSAGFNRGPIVEIADEKDAVAKTLAARGIAFNMYEVTTVMLDGKELKGAPENHTPRAYVGIDRLYTREEVIADLKSQDLGVPHGHPEMADMMRDVIDSVVEEFKKHPADSAYITGLERPGEFIRLSAGEKVFGRQGEQLWPKQAPALPVPDVKVEVKKPADKKRWTLKP